MMSRVRTKGTSPELSLRSALHSAGIRFRLHRKDLSGKPDIVLQKYQTVIQVRGCFWHGHNCKVGHLPSSRKSYWTPKILRNAERDATNEALLKKAGWKVVVLWECSCRRPSEFANEIERIASGLRRKPAIVEPDAKPRPSDKA